jgi:hypothetical protein
VVVADLDLVRVAVLPDEADAPLVVDADAELSGAVPGEPLEAVAGRAAQVDDALASIRSLRSAAAWMSFGRRREKRRSNTFSVSASRNDLIMPLWYNALRYT